MSQQLATNVNLAMFGNAFYLTANMPSIPHDSFLITSSLFTILGQISMLEYAIPLISEVIRCTKEFFDFTPHQFQVDDTIA
jgi:hypothetical protein